MLGDSSSGQTKVSLPVDSSAPLVPPNRASLGRQEEHSRALERGCQAAGRRSPYMLLAGKTAAKRLGWRACLGTGSGIHDPW